MILIGITNIQLMKKIVVLSGAGISAESGIQTFRDADGLWNGYDIMEVATPEAFAKNPQLVNDFYNQRRKQLLATEPNEAHFLLAKLQQKFDIYIITQNVDDLHERAGSKNILHLHGELLKVRSTTETSRIYDWKSDLTKDNTDEEGHNLRPHIVWFGEEVPEMKRALKICTDADVFIVIGTSLQVYPAASLLHYLPHKTKIYSIDIQSLSLPKLPNLVTSIKKTATEGMKELYTILSNKKKN